MSVQTLLFPFHSKAIFLMHLRYYEYHKVMHPCIFDLLTQTKFKLDTVLVYTFMQTCDAKFAVTHRFKLQIDLQFFSILLTAVF